MKTTSHPSRKEVGSSPKGELSAGKASVVDVHSCSLNTLASGADDNTAPHLLDIQDSRCSVEGHAVAVAGGGQARIIPHEAIIANSEGRAPRRVGIKPDRREYPNTTQAFQSFRHSGFALDELLAACEADGVTVRRQYETF